MKAGSQNGMSRESRSTSLISLGLFGLAIAFALIYNQVSLNSHARTYDQAITQTAAWEHQMADILTIRGRINGVVESVSSIASSSANSVPAIEQAISNMQMTWAHHSASVPMPTRTRLGADVELMALAAMRTAESLRNNPHEARRHAQIVAQISGSAYPMLTGLERQVELSRQESETGRLNALAGMSAGQTIDLSVLFVLAVALVGLVALVLSNFVNRINPQPRHALVTTSRGFSMIELLMVVAITLVLSTIAIANIAAVVSSSRIHAGVSSMSGLFQNCRMLAVKKNKTMTAHVTTVGSGSLMGYVKEATDSSALSTADSQVKWEAPVVRMTTPTGPGAPNVIATTALGYTPQTGNISFNSRGLPCAYASGVCTNHGFLYYFKDTSRAGAKGWAALSISPAGKIKKWFWNIGSWTE